MLNKSTAYIKINRFARQHLFRFKKHCSVKKQGTAALIIDLEITEVAGGSHCYCG
jgi:hypothetical protein